MVALAGSTNGLLTYAMLKTLNNVRGWLAWKWIFFIEGLKPEASLGFLGPVAIGALSVENGRHVSGEADGVIRIRRHA